MRVPLPPQYVDMPDQPAPLTILVDGSNAAFMAAPKVNGYRQAKYTTLAAVLDLLAGLRAEFLNITTEVLVDANLPYHIDDWDSLEADIDAGTILLCPAGAQADAFILEYARNCPGRAIIVSNDLFRGHEAPARERGAQWRFPLMVIQGQVVVPRLRDEITARCKAPLRHPVNGARAITPA